MEDTIVVLFVRVRKFTKSYDNSKSNGNYMFIWSCTDNNFLSPEEFISFTVVLNYKKKFVCGVLKLEQSNRIKYLR